MSRRGHIATLTQVLAFLTVVAVASPALATETLSIATQAPEQSPWGKVLRVWAKAVKKKSGDKLALQFFWNGTQGDAGAVVGKMKAGQLDAAAVSSIGLAKIHKPILALQMPGLFFDWKTFDKAREALRPEFEKEVATKGFIITGWGDIGRVRGMSNGFEVRRPSDLKGKKPLSYRSEAIGPVVYQVLGVPPVPMSIGEILGGLSTGKINVISAPSIAAEQLQWAPRLTHIGESSSTMAMGAMVWSKPRLDGLPGDLKTILRDTGAVASKALVQRIRQEDDAAYARLKDKMTVVKLTEAERKEWGDVFEKARRRLSQGTFPPDLVKRVEQLAQQP